MTSSPLGSPAGSRSPGDYVVVARRYRPRNFQELVGQDQVSRALANAIQTNRVGHAYLFTGARGVGKTSTARIFAKALDCESGPTPTPCGECDICQGIAAGEDIDVLEIDGASNRGIDEIRQLRSNVNIRPSRARFKIYIIDEVHMLTLQAFNALLKTLEEPPEHVKFIFCTTDPEKVPITIISRCQRFDFPPVEAASILDRLRYIVQNEGVTADEEALQLLARRANGSLRDSQSLLEQLLSFCTGRITVDDVHAMLGTARGGQVTALLERLIDRDAPGALQQADAALREGVDAGQLAEQLLGYVRDLMAATVGCGAEFLLQVPAAEYDRLVERGQVWGLETALAVVQILDQALVRMRHSTHARTLLEVALVRVARLERLDDLAELVAALRAGAAGPPPRGAGVAPAASRFASATNAAVPPSAAGAAARNSVTGGAVQTPLSGSQPAPSAESPAAEKKNAEPLILTADQARELWQQAVDSLGDMTADFARHAAQVRVAGEGRLVAGFRAPYTAHKEFCERPERRGRLEAALSSVAGRAIKLDLETLAGEAEQAPRPAPAPSSRQRIQERQRHPLVRQAIEMFDAEVVRVDEPKPGGERR